jgi:ribosomal-protein-alanine N-acetyltransferase
MSGDWRERLPELSGGRVMLREVTAADAASLFALLATEEVSRFITPPPDSVDGFERFIVWSQRQRAAGVYACFALTLQGQPSAIGIIQVRQVDFACDTAEWGFAIGSSFWGTGVFQEAAQLVLAFAFDVLGVRRLEARAAVRNGRGTGALLKLGAVQEAILPKSLNHHGEYLDQGLYAILHDEWRASVQDDVPNEGIQNSEFRIQNSSRLFDRS